MKKLKKYSSFEELKSDYKPENLTEDEIKKRHKELEEFFEILRNERETENKDEIQK